MLLSVHFQRLSVVQYVEFLSGKSEHKPIILNLYIVYYHQNVNRLHSLAVKTMFDTETLSAGWKAGATLSDLYNSSLVLYPVPIASCSNASCTKASYNKAVCTKTACTNDSCTKALFTKAFRTKASCTKACCTNALSNKAACIKAFCNKAFCTKASCTQNLLYHGLGLKGKPWLRRHNSGGESN